MDDASSYWKPSQFDLVILKEKLLVDYNEESEDIGEVLRKVKGHTSLRIGLDTFDSGLSHIVLLACSEGRLKVVRYFLDHHKGRDFDIDARIKHLRESQEDVEGKMAHLSIVSRVYCPDLVLSRNQQLHSTTLLHAAVTNNHPHIVGMLLSAGASVDVTDCCSDTPLLKSIEHQPKEISLISMLISHGANLNYQGESTFTALMLVAKSKSKHASQLVPLLLNAGADPNMTDSHGYTALHIAATEGNVEVVKLLLHHGVNPQFGERGCESLFSSPLHLSDQAMGFEVMSSYLDMCKGKQEFLNYQIVSKTVFNETQHSGEFCKVPSGVIKPFLSHPDCPSSYRSVIFLVEATSFAIANPLPGLEYDVHKYKTYISLVKRAMKIENIAFSQPLVESYFSKNDPQVKNLADIVNIIDSTSYESHVVGKCMVLVAEHLLGFGQEGVIQLLLRVLVVTNSLSTVEEHSLRLLYRASEMLLFLVNLVDGKMVAFGKIVYILLFELVTLIVKVLHLSANRFILVSPEIYGATLGNACECFGWYSRFVSSTHSHLIPSWCIQAIALPLLHCFCRWLAVGKDDHCVAVLERLVESGLVLTICEGKQTTLVHLAIEMWMEGKMRVKLVDRMLSVGADRVINMIDFNGFRPLHSAALGTSKVLVDSLLEYGAHIDATDGSGNSVTQYYKESNHSLLRSFFDSPLPLTCLSAQAIIQHGIPYKKLDYPQRLKTLISYHAYQPSVQEEES